MHRALQERYPMIRTYTGVGVSDGALLKCDLTPHGFHAMVLPVAGDAWFITRWCPAMWCTSRAIGSTTSTSACRRTFRLPLRPGERFDAEQKRTRQ